MRKVSIKTALAISVSFLSCESIAGDIEKIECRNSGCILTCQSSEQKPISYGPATEIELEILSSGVTKYKLALNLSDMQTIVVGPNSYMCSIKNQKK